MSAILPGADAPTVSNAAAESSQRTLEGTPPRAFQLLRAIATTAAIRARLATRGFSDRDQAEGVDLLAKASGFKPTGESEIVDDVRARRALAELDDLDEGLFRVANATLTRRFPEQSEILLSGLAAVRGPDAILNVRTLPRSLGRAREG